MPDPDVPTRPSSRPDAYFHSRATRAALILVPLLAGSGYILLQWQRIGRVEDAAFVSLLIAATAILVRGMRNIRAYIVERGYAFYTYVTPLEDPSRGYREFEALLGSTFRTLPMTLCGIAYGGAVGSTPLLLGLWPADPPLRAALAVFLFTVNFVTGLAFYGLVRFLLHSVRMGRLVRVDLWKRSNPSTTFLLGAARRISLLASVYVSLSLSSILVSKFPPTGLVWGYAAFAASILLWTLALPAYPISRELRKAKQAALADIDDRLQDEFNQMIGLMRRTGAPNESANLDRLIALREKVAGMDLGAVKLKSALTGLWVLVISAVPVVLQFMLERSK